MTTTVKCRSDHDTPCLVLDMGVLRAQSSNDAGRCRWCRQESPSPCQDAQVFIPGPEANEIRGRP